MAEYKKLKYYFGSELTELLAQKIEQVYPAFEGRKFIKQVANAIHDSVELKGRVAIISEALHEFLPKEYRQAMSILLKILGPENLNETGMFKEGYWLMPVAFFVEKYGINDFDSSTTAIYEITKRHTGEFTVRPFLEKYPQQMLAVMMKWSKDNNVHVRRLASEGTRPRLPWAKKLDQFIANPQPIIPILESLKEDTSLFVKKSVANNLNDILKDNYEIGMKILQKWSKSKNKNTKWIVKHALRNVLKKKNSDAVRLITS